MYAFVLALAQQSGPQQLVEARKIVETGDFKFVDYNNPTLNESRVLLFTYCNHGTGATPKHGDVGLLCETWWQAHGKAWARANRVAVAMVDVPVAYGRTQHWCKVAYSHAWMESSAPSHRFAEIVFADADAVVRRAKWGVRDFFAREDADVVMAEDDWDYASSGHMFIRNTKMARRLFEAWYIESHRFYGTLSTGQELPRSGSGLKARENVRLWYKLNSTNGFSSRKNVPKAFNGHPTVDRCSPSHTTHEQGCLPHVLTSHAALGRAFKIVPRQRVFAMRWERGREWDFLHWCCCSYEERVRELSRCIEPINNGKDCLSPR